MIARVLALLVLGIAAPVLHAQNGSAVGFTDHRGENIPDVELVDEHGAAVTMSAFKRQAYFLAFAYHTCPQLCGLVLNSFTESLRQVDGRVGSDFDVVVVSIDPADKPSSDAVAKQRYVARYGGDGHGWHFLSGDKQSIRALAAAAGFDYVYDPLQKTFVHPAGVFFVRAGGVIGGHVEQSSITPSDLQELIGGGDRASSMWNALCGALGFGGGSRTPAVMTVLRVGAAAVFALLALVLVVRRLYRGDW